MCKLERRIIEDLMVERLEKNRLIAVSGMSIEELTDAFTKGYRLVSPEAAKNLQEPKTGHWMIDEDSTDRFFATYECSCCKRAIIVPHDAMKAVYKDYPYCHCGARMVEPQESEEP